MCHCDNRLRKTELRQVICGTIPFDNIWWPGDVMEEVMKGVRPGKPEDAASLGFTCGLWEVVELCWLADRDARPTLSAVLSCLSEAAPGWDDRRKVV